MSVSAVLGPDGIHLAVVAGDNAGWQEELSAGDGITAINSWSSLGGSLLGAPSVAGYGPSGTFDIYAIGTDHNIWEQSYAGGWTGWRPVGGGGQSGPAENEMVSATRAANGNIDLLVRGRDGAAWHGAVAASNTLYSTWTPMYGTVLGTPNGAQDGSNGLTVYGVGPNGVGNLNCWWNSYPKTFEPWASVGGAKAA